MRKTFYADVGGFEVVPKLFLARLSSFKFCVRNADVARFLAGTTIIGLRQNVRLTANHFNLRTYTMVFPHTSVSSLRHEDDPAVLALCLEGLGVAVVAFVLSSYVCSGCCGSCCHLSCGGKGGGFENCAEYGKK